MDYKRLDAQHIMCRLDPDEEIVASLQTIATQENIKLAMIQGLGAVKEVVAGVFNVGTKEYKSNTFKGWFEIVSLTGTIDSMEGKLYTHFHISVGDEEGKVFGGHLNKAVISATAEIIITILPGEIDREHSEKIGLNILKF